MLDYEVGWAWKPCPEDREEQTARVWVPEDTAEPPQAAKRISRGIRGNMGWGGGARVVLLLRSELVGHHPSSQTQSC